MASMAASDRDARSRSSVWTLPNRDSPPGCVGTLRKGAMGPRPMPRGPLMPGEIAGRGLEGHVNPTHAAGLGLGRARSMPSWPLWPREAPDSGQHPPWLLARWHLHPGSSLKHPKRMLYQQHDRIVSCRPFHMYDNVSIRGPVEVSGSL